jgi:hypothetical protein
VGRSRLIIGTFGWLPMRPRSSRRPVVGVDLAAIPMEDACRLIASVDPSEVTPSFMSPRVGTRVPREGVPIPRPLARRRAVLVNRPALPPRPDPCGRYRRHFSSTCCLGFHGSRLHQDGWIAVRLPTALLARFHRCDASRVEYANLPRVS